MRDEVMKAHCNIIAYDQKKNNSKTYTSVILVGRTRACLDVIHTALYTSPSHAASKFVPVLHKACRSVQWSCCLASACSIPLH